MGAPPRSTPTERGRRTRDAVVLALYELLREGEPDPNARRIAERAGVSLRSIYVHFAGIEDLYRAVNDLAVARVVSMLSPIDPAQPLAARVDLLCSQRARVHEELAPVRRAADVRRASSPALQAAHAFGRKASRDQVDRVFASELGVLDAATGRRRAAAVDAAVSPECWEVLRDSHGLTVEEARLALVEALLDLLEG